MVEYLLQHQENKQFFHKTIYRPQAGKIRLPEAPGLGIELDEQKISARQELTYEES
jgi:L-alanine-DL-glutamate epimerase-like enolase superfamily enzyme